MICLFKIKGLLSGWKSILFLSVLIFISCVKKSEFIDSSYYDFGEKGMIPDREYIFYPFEKTKEVIDKELTFYITVRFSDRCGLKSIPLSVEYGSLDDDQINNSEFTIPLFDDYGNSKGKGNWGIYEVELPFLKDKKYEEGFFISLSTQEKDTHGILSLGIISK